MDNNIILKIIFIIFITHASAFAEVNNEEKVIVASFSHNSPGIQSMEKAVRAMYEEANIPIEIQRFTMARALMEAKAGRVDALLAHPVDSESMINGFVPIGNEIATIKFALFSTQDKGEDLNNYRIIMLRGMPFIEKVLEEKKGEFITNSEVEAIVKLINLNRYNATIMNVEVSDWAKAKVPGLKQVSPIITQFKIIHYISVKKTEVIKKLKALTRLPKKVAL